MLRSATCLFLNVHSSSGRAFCVEINMVCSKIYLKFFSNKDLLEEKE